MPAVEATAADSEDTTPVSAAPLSRRAARQRLNTAEVFVAATAVAAATAATDSAPAAEGESAPGSPATAEAAAVTESEAPAAAEPEVETVAVSEPAEPAALPEPETISEPAPEVAANADAFETASRAFRTVAPQTAPTQTSSTADEASAADEESAADEGSEAADAVPGIHVARRRPSARKFFAAGATVGVMGLAGLLAVGMTLPAEAVAAVQGATPLAATSLVASDAVAADDDEIQAFVTSSDVQNESLARSDSFSTMSLVEVASEEGINYSNEVFTNDPDAAIQWPFKVGVGMSSGYGMRWGRLHEGIDFVPGEGAPIQAIADGVVRIATEQGAAYGVTVYIDHVIDGQVITSHYSHMQYGSLQVKAGQTVKVGDVVGHTGNTGRSYGAHLHFELIINGSTIDPLPWLRENAGRYSY
ncbi:peptidoglycan DD-metalloendopeptidase family protein [Microbacterium sp. NPDC089695]|uniref:peptidoglycan DD-metalloendopeptidase family protein n=1 Tax=Microbacterium sp. NPDC089695 TaxID=3364198 RepID=UPI0038147C04